MNDTFHGARILGNFRTGSKAWHRARKISGSRISAILETELHNADPELHPPPRYQSAYDVWMALVGKGEEDTSTVAMRRGNFVEPFILTETGRALDLEVKPYKASLAHPEHDWATCNLDGFEESTPQIVEAKDITPFAHLEWTTSGVPFHIQVQTQWQLACVPEVDTCLVAALFGGTLELFPFQRDEEDIALLLETGEKFWRDHVVTETPPNVDSSDGCAKYLANKYRVSTGKVRQLDPISEALFDAYDKACEDEALARTRKARAANELLALIGDADKAQSRGWTAHHIRPRRLDFEALATDHPEVVNEYRCKFDGSKFAKEQPSLKARYSRQGTGFVKVHRK